MTKHDEPLVIVDEPGSGVRRLTLNRPEKRNALSIALLDQLFDEMRGADCDTSVRVVILRGAGVCFSSGYDLGGQPGTTSVGRPLTDGFWPRKVVDGWFEMWDYSIPLIGQVHGYCLAGGSELAAACDLLYVAEDAQIGYPPVRLMSPPDMTWQPWFMGLRRGMEALLTGDAMTGVEAVQAGFANRAFHADELDTCVEEIANRVALIPRDLLTLNKRTVHRAMEAMGIRNGIRATTELQTLGLHQAASKEYVAKFAQGVTKALQARDEPFGDYRTGSD
ncbi:MAG: enoyl-CoA hydratase-related protein [Acidimicrobiia bacterium]